MELLYNWKNDLTLHMTLYPDHSMTEAVYAVLLDAIVSFRLPPDTKLIVSHLAQEMGISMTPVREAVMALQETGLVTVGAGKKTFVSGYSEKSCDDLQALRVPLECLAAELVCQNAPASFIGELSDMVEENIGIWERCKDDFSLYPRQITADLNFHLALVRASGNRFLIEQYERIWPSITFVRQFFSPFGFNLAEYPQAHRAIPVALATRDPQFARSAMLMHFKTIFSAELIK